MITTIFTVTKGWQEAALALAGQGCRFSIMGIDNFQEMSFCNSVATTFGYHLSIHRGLAAFTRPVSPTDEEPEELYLYHTLPDVHQPRQSAP